MHILWRSAVILQLCFGKTIYYRKIYYAGKKVIPIINRISCETLSLMSNGTNLQSFQ